MPHADPPHSGNRNIRTGPVPFPTVTWTSVEPPNGIAFASRMRVFATGSPKPFPPIPEQAGSAALHPPEPVKSAAVTGAPALVR